MTTTQSGDIKVVVSDPMQIRLATELADAAGAGFAWDFHTWSDATSRDEVIADADVFIGSQLSAELAARGANLRLVQVAGAGYEGIAVADLPASATVANTFHHGRSIAEYVVLAELALERDLLIEDRELRSNRWRSVFYNDEAPVHRTLRGKRVGIIGYGEIGRAVSDAMTALGATVVAIRRSTPAPNDGPTPGIGGAADLHRLLAESDVVVVAVPSNEETKGLIGVEALAKMKHDAHLINVSRGPVIQEEALFDALQRRQIAGAAIDVWWNYPTSDALAEPSHYDFASLDNVIMTPHTSGVTHDVFHLRLADVAHNLRALRDGAPLLNVVRAASTLGMPTLA